MCTCFLYWGVYPLALLTWIWEVAFWTVTKCDSHKLRQFRNPCRRILWFVAFCDHGRDGTNWVQLHWKRVLGTWESTHVHFWHEYQKFHFCPFWRYFTVMSDCVFVYQMYMFPVLRSIPSCTTDMNLRSCILNRHKMRQSQIATIQESLPSHFVICRILWSWPWRHKLSPITLKTCSGYLGEYPGSLLTWIWKVVFLPILVLFHWYICLCVCLSVIKLIIDVPRKSSWKGPILMWTSFLHLAVHPRLLWNLSEQLHFEPSQIATVTNCDNSGIPAVAICDLSQFVIKAVTAQTESNNIENVFCVLGRVPMITFDRNLWDWVLIHFRISCYMYCV